MILDSARDHADSAAPAPLLTHRVSIDRRSISLFAVFSVIGLALSLAQGVLKTFAGGRY